MVGSRGVVLLIETDMIAFIVLSSLVENSPFPTIYPQPEKDLYRRVEANVCFDSVNGSFGLSFIFCSTVLLFRKIMIECDVVGAGAATLLGSYANTRSHRGADPRGNRAQRAREDVA